MMTFEIIINLNPSSCMPKAEKILRRTVFYILEKAGFSWQRGNLTFPSPAAST
jgi:hypothetical protein